MRQAALQSGHQVVGEAAADDVVQEHGGQVGDPFVQLEISLVERDISASVVHSHWSRSYITALSLVESFPSDASASSLMP